MTTTQYPEGFVGELAKFFGWYNHTPCISSNDDGVLIPGVSKPTLVLAQMIAADILANGYVSKEDEGNAERRQRFRDGWQVTVNDPYHYYYTVTTRVAKFRISDCQSNLSIVRIHGGVDFSKEEGAIMLAAMKKWDDLAQERKAAEVEAANQQKALDAIERFMGIGTSPREDDKFAKPESKPVQGCEFSCCTPGAKIARRKKHGKEVDLLTPVKECL